MNSKINYIRSLVYLGKIDRDFHEKEKQFVRSVGTRLGLEPSSVEEELIKSIDERHPLPVEEILRFMLLDDLLNLIALDGKLLEEEIVAVQHIAEELGFSGDVVAVVSSKIKAHLAEGFGENATQDLIKDELYKSISKNFFHEKYS